MPRLWGGLPDDYDMCGRCVGSGKVPGPGTGYSKCPRCDGLGRVRKPRLASSSPSDPSTKSRTDYSTTVGDEPSTPGDLQASYDQAVLDAHRAKADLLQKLDEIHSQLYPLALSLPPGIERDPQIDVRYAEWRAQNRKLRDWIESLDPLSASTEQSLRQLRESWQGQGDAGMNSLLLALEHACNSVNFYATLKPL